jgi:hypothetical protein
MLLDYIKLNKLSLLLLLLEVLVLVLLALHLFTGRHCYASLSTFSYLMLVLHGVTCMPRFDTQGTGWSAMDWSGDPQHFPFGGSNNVFWNVYASGIPVPAGASNQRLARRSVRIHGQDSTYNRPAYMQGWGQIVVDMPVDPNSRYIREAGDWFVSYDPARPVYPSDLFKAMRESQGARLQLAPGARTPPALFAVRPVPA